MEEGGVGIENTILLKKYQFCQEIGQGRNGTVYLALHRELDEKRAIKRVPKTAVAYEQFRQEALLLKELRHPGIPIVYDMEEDSDYSYLIEEYLEGDSLYDLVKNQGPLSQETVLRYGIQICNLVNYLHFAGEIPILYLDLQPRNLLVCHETVKLIDFDHAATASMANEADKRYGTPGYCAPEQMDVAEPLDIRADVYAIGSILYYLKTGAYPGVMDEEAPALCGKQLWHVIQTCLKSRREDRYHTAEEVKQALEAIREHTPEWEKIGKHRMGVLGKYPESSLIIALTGSKSGVGTTHLSFSLSEYLRQAGHPNLYEEHNRSGTVRRIAAQKKQTADNYGILKIKGMWMKPWYGAAVSLKEHRYPVVVRDYGTDWEALKNSEDIDVILLVCSGAWWDEETEQEALNCLKKCQNIWLVYNHPMPGMRRKPPEGMEKDRCFQVPYQPDPLQTDRQMAECWRGMMKRTWSGEEGTSLRSFLRKTAGRICRKIVSSV